MYTINDIQEVNNENGLTPNTQSNIAHYTSIGALKCIIAGIHSDAVLKLRATCASFTDDKEELKEGYEYLMKMLKAFEEGKEEKFKLSNYMSDVQDVDKYNRYSEENLKSWFYSERRTPYILCFSHLVDEISMWQTPYAQSGEGACLVFNLSTMRYDNTKLLINEPLPVVYGDRLGYHKEKQLFQNLIMDKYYEFAKKISQIEEKDTITSLKLQSLEEICSFISSYFKRGKWYFQQEIRIMCNTIEDCPSCVKEDDKKRPYVEVPIPLSCLRKVIIGPKASDSNVDDIRNRLSLFGFNSEDVYKSNEPLR